MLIKNEAYISHVAEEFQVAAVRRKQTITKGKYPVTAFLLEHVTVKTRVMPMWGDKVSLNCDGWMGLLFIPQQPLWNATDRDKPKNSKNSLFQRQFVHHNHTTIASLKSSPIYYSLNILSYYVIHLVPSTSNFIQT